MIAERQEKAARGRAIVENLSADLRREFPGVAGFSVQNLWYMRQFYMEYSGNERLQPLVGEIAWAHNLAITLAPELQCQLPQPEEIVALLEGRMND